MRCDVKSKEQQWRRQRLQRWWSEKQNFFCRKRQTKREEMEVAGRNCLNIQHILAHSSFKLNFQESNDLYSTMWMNVYMLYVIYVHIFAHVLYGWVLLVLRRRRCSCSCLLALYFLFFRCGMIGLCIAMYQIMAKAIHDYLAKTTQPGFAFSSLAIICESLSDLMFVFLCLREDDVCKSINYSWKCVGFGKAKKIVPRLCCFDFHRNSKVSMLFLLLFTWFGFGLLEKRLKINDYHNSIAYALH